MSNGWTTTGKIMENKVYKVAEADGICYKCKKHVMKDCECFFGRLFIDDQPDSSKREDSTKEFSQEFIENLSQKNKR